MPTRRRVLCFVVPSILFTVAGIAAMPVVSSSRPVTEPWLARSGVESVRVGHDAIQHSLSQSTAWQSFESRNGKWHVLWNEATGTPHRAFGPSIRLTGFANDAASVDRSVRVFIAGHPELFGGAGIVLENRSTSLHGAVWYVRYQQMVQGLPVLFSDWEFRVGKNGHLMMFGADPRTATVSIDNRSRLTTPVVREAARQGMRFDPATDRVELGAAPAWVPTPRPDGTPDLRLAYDATVRSARAGASEHRFIDARDGRVLWRQELHDDAVQGNISAQVHLTTPWDPLSTRNVRNATVTAGSASAVTDTFGHYSVSALSYPTTIATAFVGPYCTVVRSDGPASSSFSKSNTSDGSTVNVTWTTSNSQNSERDAYYHVNLAHDWVKAIDYSLTAIDYSLTVNVNWNDGTDCEADWDQPSNSLNYWLEGANCPNTATIPDLIYHEYAHMVNYNLYYTNGAASGLTNKSLGEGLADAFTVLFANEPLVGNGFTGPGTFIRDVRVGARYPENDTPNDPHGNGLIIAGALWDLRTATNGAVASRLSHLAKYGLPDDADDGVAFSEYFIDMLVADDNDADLGNGTPSLPSINASFSAHGIGMNYFLDIAHNPLADTPTNGPYPINATITYGGPIGGLGPATLYYSVNGTPFASKPMLPTGNPDEFGADIPGQSYGIVKYYIQATDSYGGTRTLPAGAPVTTSYTFLAGGSTTLSTNNCEAPDGWTVGFAGDSATTGIWIRAVPVASIAQPGADHSSSGTQCWVTGNALVGDDPGVNDVDDGRTTLVTSTFTAVGTGLINPVVSYWRWFSNNTGDAGGGEDPWRTYISNNNGSTWSVVENTKASSNNSWQRIAFFIKKYVTPTSTMKMRFVAQDTLPNPSVVEAAVDDWLVVAYSATNAVPAPSPGAELALQPVWPNPARGDSHLRFSLPAAGRVEMSIFDLEGRKVRTLIDGDRTAGPQSAVWDGRDDSGHPVRSGPYYVRLSRGAQDVTRAIVLVR